MKIGMRTNNNNYLFLIFSTSSTLMLLVVFTISSIMIYYKTIYRFYFHINKKKCFLTKKKMISELRAKQLKLLIQFNSTCISNSIIKYNYVI
jgi:hypothetical protein